jgi:tRNA (guanine-N7-)-methyltransferase
MPIEEAQRIHQEQITQVREALASVPLSHPALTLEIGCGHGHFLTAYAASRPDEHCLAIDIIADRLEKAARKTAKAGLTNVSWLRASSTDFLNVISPDVRFNRRIFILFPDPWPKRKHWGNRLIQTEFLDQLAAFSSPGTEMCFRTDYAPYFESAADVIGAHPSWNIDENVPWPFESRTVFEERAEGFQSLIAIRVPHLEGLPTHPISPQTTDKHTQR